jgi:RNA polymerase sigma factor (sigma-70 family)
MLRFRSNACYGERSRAMATAPNNLSAEQLRSELGARFQRPLMTFFLRRVKDRSLAEDLTQDVLLKVVRASERGQIARADSYVFKVAINLLRDHRRRALRAGPAVFLPIEEDRDGHLESQLVEAISPERVLLSKDSLADVLRSLEELGDLTQKIFILFRLENMKQKDIAALYGIGQSTVEKHVMKAVVHLAQRYGHD